VDYKGDEFTSVNAARDYATATAQRLANKLSGEWAGWTLEVRSPIGQKYFSVPIGEPIGLVAQKSPITTPTEMLLT
jgi:hypothetical protein